MERIRQLFQSFSKSEVKALKTYLTAFHTKGENKQFELITLIEKNGSITQESASKKLYGDPKSKAFIMMKSRLYEKMLELLSLSVFTEGKRTDGEELLQSNPVEIRKLMLSGQELVRRKQFLMATEQFDAAYHLAKKNSFHEHELDALLRLSVFKGLMDKKAEVDETGSHHGEIQRVMKKLDVYIKAVCTKEIFTKKFSLSAAGDDAKIKFLEAAIPPLEADMDGLESLQTDYIINGLKIFYLSFTDRIEECRKVVQKQIHTIEAMGKLDSEKRYPPLLYQVGMLELKAHNYQASIEAFEKTVTYHTNKSSHSYFKIRIMEMYPLIYSENYPALKTLVEELERLRVLPVNKENTNFQSLLSYFLAIYQYKIGNIRKAWQLAQIIEELDFDKEGWIAGLRTVEIMFLIELEEYDLAGARIETLRKHISRYPGDKRVEVMQKLLAGQERISFSFSSFKAEQNLLNQLESEVRWVHFGHELIRYDVWYREMKKRKGQLPTAPLAK